MYLQRKSDLVKNFFSYPRPNMNDPDPGPGENPTPVDLYTSPRNMRRTSPRNIRRTLPHYIRRTLPHYIRRTSPRNIRRTSPRYIRRTSPRNIRRTSPRNIRRTSPRNKRRQLEVGVGPDADSEVVDGGEDLDTVREVALPTHVFLEGCGGRVPARDLWGGQAGRGGYWIR